eukprot:TRINITY_DN16224_c0_g1_i2.p1 TRINITY_DN16224_c0_g1~~TRINITY_DN16224_c0_g1_i2.p1  ORF type:complete len:570 (+),score=64.40 TRINITY_DN16224_c0_g1_i2:47-1756(+)
MTTRNNKYVTHTVALCLLWLASTTPNAGAQSTCLANAGQACGSSTRCGSGLVCFNNTKCIPEYSISIGGACEWSEQCQIGSFCNQTSGRCEALLPAGSSIPCTAYICARNSFCNISRNPYSSGSSDPGNCVAYFSTAAGGVGGVDNYDQRGSCQRGLGLRGGICVSDPKNESECTQGAPGNYWCSTTSTCGNCCGQEEVDVSATANRINVAPPLDYANARYRLAACWAVCTGGATPVFSSTGKAKAPTGLTPPPTPAPAGCFVGLGQPCNSSTSNMAFGVTCSNGVGALPVALPANSPCSSYLDCAQGLYCNASWGLPQLGFCLPRKKVGEGCSGSIPDECVAGSDCNQASSYTCVAYRSLGPNVNASSGSMCQPGLGYDRTTRKCKAPPVTEWECSDGQNVACNNGSCVTCCPEYNSVTSPTEVYEAAVMAWEYESCVAKCTGGLVPVFGTTSPTPPNTTSPPSTSNNSNSSSGGSTPNLKLILIPAAGGLLVVSAVVGLVVKSRAAASAATAKAGALPADQKVPEEMPATQDSVVSVENDEEDPVSFDNIEEGSAAEPSGEASGEEE